MGKDTISEKKTIFDYPWIMTIIGILAIIAFCFSVAWCDVHYRHYYQCQSLVQGLEKEWKKEKAKKLDQCIKQKEKERDQEQAKERDQEQAKERDQEQAKERDQEQAKEQEPEPNGGIKPSQEKVNEE